MLTSIERKAYFPRGIFYEWPHTHSGQNTNKKKIHYRGLLFHLLGRFGLRPIYMLVPEMFRNLLGRRKGIVAFWTCKASIRHHV